jgi:hypothetical protein
MDQPHLFVVAAPTPVQKTLTGIRGTLVLLALYAGVVLAFTALF